MNDSKATQAITQHPPQSSATTALSVEEQLKAAQLVKLQFETELLRRPWWKQFDTIAKVLIAVLGLIGAGVAIWLGIPQRTLEAAKLQGELIAVRDGLSRTKQELSENQIIKERLGVEADQYRQTLDRLKKEIDEKNLQKLLQQSSVELVASAKPSVFIQFAGDLKRDLILKLGDSLKSSNFAVPKPERLQGPNRTEVRYFLPKGTNDAEQIKRAQQVLDVTKNFFSQMSCPITDARVVPKEGTSPIELWINHNCETK